MRTVTFESTNLNDLFAVNMGKGKGRGSKVRDRDRRKGSAAAAASDGAGEGLQSSRERQGSKSWTLRVIATQAFLDKAKPSGMQYCFTPRDPSDADSFNCKPAGSQIAHSICIAWRVRFPEGCMHDCCKRRCSGSQAGSACRPISSIYCSRDSSQQYFPPRLLCCAVLVRRNGCHHPCPAGDVKLEAVRIGRRLRRTCLCTHCEGRSLLQGAFCSSISIWFSRVGAVTDFGMLHCCFQMRGSSRSWRWRIRWMAQQECNCLWCAQDGCPDFLPCSRLRAQPIPPRLPLPALLLLLLSILTCLLRSEDSWRIAPALPWRSREPPHPALRSHCDVLLLHAYTPMQRGLGVMSFGCSATF